MQNSQKLLDDAMPLSDKVTLAGRAMIGWSLLPRPVQARALATLENLAGRPPEQWAGGEVEKWWSRDDLHALHVWVDGDELLIFFLPEEDGRIRIDGGVLKQFLDRYFAGNS